MLHLVAGSGSVALHAGGTREPSPGSNLMTNFEAQHATTRILFRPGSWSALPDELARLGLERALVVSTPRGEAEARTLAGSLGARAQAVLPIAAQHVPAEAAERARRAAQETRADAVIAVGGGSAIGLGKAVALDGTAALIALPTTCSGSEMTSIYGITGGKEKRTGRDERVRAALVLYDPSAVASVPAPAWRASVWNAVAHAVQALWSEHG